MEVYVWFFGIAVVFTWVGYSWGFRKRTENVVKHTITSLINQGYLKCRQGSSGEVEILRHDETR